MNRPIQIKNNSCTIPASVTFRPVPPASPESHSRGGLRPINPGKINRHNLQGPVFPFSVCPFPFSNPNRNTAANRNRRNSLKQKEKTFSNRNKNGCFLKAQFSPSGSAICSGNAHFRPSTSAFPSPHERNTRVPNSTGVPSNPTAPFLDGGPICVTLISFPSL